MPEEAPPAGNAAQESPIDALVRILNDGEAREAPEMPLEFRHLDEKLKLQEIELKREYASQEIQLRRSYARGLLAILALQIAAADVVFWVFAEVGEHWHLSDGVIQIWLAAAVVQIVGVVTVVTRHLFPRRDDKPPDGPH
jgi:hypothetical protein